MNTNIVDSRTRAAQNNVQAPQRVCRKPLQAHEYQRRLALIGERGSLHRVGLVTLRASGSLDPGFTNVPLLGITSEGPDWGHVGFAPADLALSVMHALLPPVTCEIEQAEIAAAMTAAPGTPRDLAKQVVLVGTNGTRVSLLAYRLHILFMCRFLVWMPDVGGIVMIDVIKQWIADESRVLAFQDTQPECLMQSQGFVGCWD